MSSAPAPLTIIGPYIVSLAPVAVNPEETVTLNGGGFGDTQGGSTLTIGGTVAAVASWSETIVVAIVPRLPAGPLDVVVTVNGMRSAPATLRILGTGDVQVTLEWGNTNDLDLHVIDPSSEEIYYLHPTSTSGGLLDVDANAGCQGVTTQPRENIFWPPGKAPQGMYTVCVVYYEGCSDPETASAFTVRVRIAVAEKYVINDKTAGPPHQNSMPVTIQVPPP